MALTKSTLLGEIDGIFSARSNATLEGTLGPNINVYSLRAILLRLGDVAEEHNINFMVFKEGLGPEAASYLGNPLNTVFARKIHDYIHVTQGWIGVIQNVRTPMALCRVIKSPAAGEEWIVIEETAPDVFNVSDVTGTVIV